MKFTFFECIIVLIIGGMLLFGAFSIYETIQETPKIEARIFSSGKEAAKIGISELANPYDKEDYRARTWLNGYIEGKKESK